MALTPKKEAFAVAVASGKSQAEAYRLTYSVRKNTKQETIHQCASRLMADRKVSARVAELQQITAERNQLTVDDLIQELEEARQAALQAPNPQSAAAVSASMGKAKLLGFLIDKSETTKPQDDLVSALKSLAKTKQL